MQRCDGPVFGWGGAGQYKFRLAAAQVWRIRVHRLFGFDANNGIVEIEHRN